MATLDFRSSVNALNQLLIIHYRSLPMYLVEATPWTHRGDAKATEVLLDIVSDQQRTCQRIADQVNQEGGIVDMGDYPSQFAEMNFLSLDFLLKRVAEYQQRDVDTIRGIVEQLSGNLTAQVLAKESLGAAQGHLKSLEELTAEICNDG